MDGKLRPAKPSVFEYEDYRRFLRDLYDHYKASTRHFSYRYFSQRAGFSSPNVLKQVIDGKRNISARATAQFIKALKLNQGEGEFFASLVEFCQSRGGEHKAKAAKTLLRSKTFRKAYPLKEAELNYYANWFYIPIRELAGTPGFREDAEWIASRFQPPLAASQVNDALNDLIKLGLLKRDHEDRLCQAHKDVLTASEVSSALVAQYHKDMMSLASSSIETVDRSQREISGTCITCSPKTVAKVKELVREFRKEILAVAGEDANSDMVYQLNFQFFPVVNGVRRRDS